MKCVGRSALRTGVIAGALAILLVPTQGAARRGPPEGSAAWLRGQEVLSRPGAALAAARAAEIPMVLQRGGATAMMSVSERTL